MYIALQLLKVFNLGFLPYKDNRESSTICITSVLWGWMTENIITIRSVLEQGLGCLLWHSTPTL